MGGGGGDGGAAADCVAAESLPVTRARHSACRPSDGRGKHFTRLIQDTRTQEHPHLNNIKSPPGQ